MSQEVSFIDHSQNILHTEHKMKFMGFLLIALASVHVGSATLEDDLNDFQALFPSEQLGKLVDKYYENDYEFRQLVMDSHYSPDHQLALIEIQRMPEIEEFCQWVNAHHNVSDPFQPQIITLQHKRRRAVRSIDNGLGLGGWKGFVKEFKEIFPLEAWIELRERKVERGGIFAEFYEKVLGMKRIYDRIEKLQSYQRYLEQMEQHGVNYAEMRKFLYQLLGWK